MNVSGGMPLLFGRIGKSIRPVSGLAPLGAAVQLRILLRAMWRGPRRIVWKGRTYTHGVGVRSA